MLVPVTISMWLSTVTKKDLWWQGRSKSRRREETRASEKHSWGAQASGHPGGTSGPGCPARPHPLPEMWALEGDPLGSHV